MAVSAVNIRPGVSILSVLRHLNYRPWFALAEFVDNAVQSYLSNEERLQSLTPPAGPLIVRIDIEAVGASRITIRDNAGGIDEASYERAFRPAAIPSDSSGLSEFGMGMKSAACWFSPRWHVRTSALGEAVERTVRFDIDRIVKDDISELVVEERPAAPETHFTEVVLDELHRPPIGRTVGKIKEHLTDIFRVFLRRGVMQLIVNGESLAYVEPRVLVAPHFRTPDAQPLRWRKDIKFDLGQGLSVEGFAAIRETASVSSAGFALFRRARLIQGSADEGYRPEHIFGKPNSYGYQRLFGELHLRGFEVAQTKDGIRWDENEQPFLELLLEHLDSDDMPLIRQANGYRARVSRVAIQNAARQAVDQTAQTLERTLEPVLEAVADKAPESEPLPEQLPEQGKLAERALDIRFRDVNWRIVVELNDDPGVGEWLAVGDTGRPTGDGTPRLLRLRLSLAHPFMVRFSGADSSGIEPLLRAAAAIGLAEVLAREAGIGQAGTIRRNVNDLLRDSLSQP
ncbi:conserved hypothetical protein [Mesorhizobium plurifarium]|uniref:ATP-binding protein n=1 Tax=Mesorhizobium plurifarium TaxID=69974 RepID=A0A090G044_MESPL|nr:conserved hypothetical protein [Mesorhizobium plurifarium]